MGVMLTTPKAGIFVLILGMCGCAFRPIAPSEVTNHMTTEWRIAQDNLVSIAGQAAYTVSITQFEVKVTDGIFSCGGAPANGCFSSVRKRITWNTHTPTVIRHEAGHAILWRLGYACWRTYEHIDYPWGCR